MTEGGGQNRQTRKSDGRRQMTDHKLRHQEVTQMASEAQILANRRNAQKSIGPHRQKVLEIRSIPLLLCAFGPLLLQNRRRF